MLKQNCCLFLLYTLVFSVVNAADYWPEGEDLKWMYVNPEGWENSIRSGGSPSESFDIAVNYGSGFSILKIAFNEVRNLSAVAEVEVPGETFIFSPPLEMFRLPPVIGDSWTSVSLEREIFCEVLREETVVVPAGEFETKVINVVCLTEPDWYFAGEYYLNREIGPVIVPTLGELESFSYEVSVEESSWGSLKALFK